MFYGMVYIYFVGVWCGLFVVFVCGAEEVSGSSRRVVSPYLACLALLVLLIPICFCAYFSRAWYRRYKRRKAAEALRLNGVRQPGEVDDAEMGHAMENRDWLSSTQGGCNGGLGRNGLCTVVDDGSCDYQGGRTTGTKAPSEAVGFDPIGHHAAIQRTRQITRREAVAGLNATVRFDSGIGSRSIADGDDVEGDDAMQQLYATSIMQATSMQRRSGCSHEGVAGPGLAGIHVPGLRATDSGDDMAASSPNFSPALPGGMDAVMSPTYHDPEYFNQTARVLLGCYPALDSTDAVGSPGASAVYSESNSNVLPGGVQATAMAPSSAPSEKRGVKVPIGKFASSVTQTFENLLSTLAAPLHLGEEFHQKGDNATSLRPTTTTTAAPTTMAEGPPSEEAGSFDEPVFRDEEHTDYEETYSNTSHP